MGFAYEFKQKLEWRRLGMGLGGEGEGEGLLNFHFIFQKTWAEPGNPS